MLKVFDKVYDTAPFLQKKLSSNQIHKRQLAILTILVLGATVNFGYTFLLHLTISLTVALIIVWTVNFFSHSLFYNSKQWIIVTMIYVLCLAPNISITNNILGLITVFLLGAGILTLKNKSIVSPVLLGIIGSQLLYSNYNNTYFVPIPFLIQPLLKDFSLDSMINFFIHNNQIITSDILTQPTTHLQNISPFLISTQVPWFGSGSILLLILTIFCMKALRVILLTPVLLYVVSYMILDSSLQFIQNQSINPDQSICNNMLWFCAATLLISPVMPQYKKGQAIFAISTAIITILLNFRQEAPINYISAIIITNLASPFFDYLTKQTIFSKKNTESDSKIEFKLSYKLRIIIGSIFLVVSLLSTHIFFKTPLLDRQENAQLRTIQRLFPRSIIQELPNNPNVYQIASENNYYIIYSTTSLYRSTVELIIEVKNNTIVNTRVLSVNTAYTYDYDFTWMNVLTNTDIRNLEQTLVKVERDITKKPNNLVIKTIIQTLLQGQKIFNSIKGDSHATT